MLRTTLLTFFAVLLVGNMVVRALPVDNGANTIFDQLLDQNQVERRSHKQVTGNCVSKCVSCSKYVGMIADKCIRGCLNKPSMKGAINNAEVDSWTACELFLYR